MTGTLDEQGFTLIEMLVAMLMTSVIMGAVVLLFTSFIDDNRYQGMRDDVQAQAQTVIDRMSREIRSAAAPSVGSATIQNSGSYDVIFQGVSATGSAPSGNASNEMWIRYCLGSNNTLWRQTTTPANTTSTMPDNSACPSTSTTWVQKTSGSPCCKELTDVTNEIGGDTTRPLFTYDPTGFTSNSQIKSVEISLYVDENSEHLPGPTELTSAVDLRNDLEAPTSSFSYSYSEGQSTTAVTLNGSGSSDPQGQALTYQWYEGSGTSISCSANGGAPSSGEISGATSQTYNASFTNNTKETFALVVTDTANLSYCSAQTYTIP